MDSHTSRRFFAVILLTAAVLPACSDDDGTAVVTLDGETLLVIGETTQLQATTTNATDTAYQWMSTNPTVATVDQTGMVTARATGEARIRATGNSSGKTGMFPIVVSAEAETGVPFFDEWSNSPHNLETAEAFRHWDADGEIPESCAKCHSTGGFRDFLGADGTAAGVVDSPAELGTTVECAACHSEQAMRLDSVTFPSGVTISGLGREAICMSCHQGRESSDSVDDAIPPGADEDVVLPDVGFINVHYFPAGATRYGGEVRGGYLYEDKSYDVFFKHVPGLEACQDCHNPHTLELRLEVCADCHNVTTLQDLRDIRMASSVPFDYDGDGNKVEGIFFEIETLRTKLLTAIQRYATEVIGTSVLYSETSYPYWFKDTNGNGTADPGEIGFPNRFTTFTPRLLKASFNFQYATKDPGGFAHNGKFIIQILHDSIEDLNAAVSMPVDMSMAVRNDSGHFDGTAEAFRHWDEDGAVQASCAKCHGGSPGLDEFLTYGSNTEQPITSGFDCGVCHSTFDTFELRRVETVVFPGGKTVEIDDTVPTDSDEARAQICINCHQGRTSKKDIDDAIAAGNLNFQNVHYLAAGATLFGTEVQVGYEYPGKTYEGKFLHFGEGTASHHCTFCHDAERTEHIFLPHEEDNLQFCQQCHAVADLRDIRLNRPLDYDGDGDNTERLVDEVHGMADALLAEIQDYADTVLGKPIVYDPAGYPYFFNDLDGDGITDANEVSFGNRYRSWDAKLLRAAHNYQHSQKEPGAWAHNVNYICQLLFDSIDDLGGDVSGFNRPPS